MDDSHDLGYALHKEFWHKGIACEASKALINQLKKDGIPSVSYTHLDVYKRQVLTTSFFILP